MNEIILWMPRSRTAYIITDWDGNILEQGAPLSAEEVYCDLCNADVVVRPVPVIGSYALCIKCLAEVEPQWAKQIPLWVLAEWEQQIEEWASE